MRVDARIGVASLLAIAAASWACSGPERSLDAQFRPAVPRWAVEDLRGAEQLVGSAGGNRPPWVATPTTAVVGPNASASSTVATTGIPCSLSPALVESQIATVGSGA